MSIVANSNTGLNSKRLRWRANSYRGARRYHTTICTVARPADPTTGIAEQAEAGTAFATLPAGGNPGRDGVARWRGVDEGSAGRLTVESFFA